MTLKFDGWPRKIIGCLFYTTSSFVHHFKSIGEFKLELQSGNAQFGSNLSTFLSCVTFKFDGWPKKKKKNGARLLCYFKLCASFQTRQWVTVRKPSILVKLSNSFFPRDLDIWWMTLKKNRASISYYIKLMHHFKAMGKFKLELQSGNPQFGSKLAIFLSHVILKFDGCQKDWTIHRAAKNKTYAPIILMLYSS